MHGTNQKAQDSFDQAHTWCVVQPGAPARACVAHEPHVQQIEHVARRIGSKLVLLARAQVDLVKRRQRMSALTVRRLQGIESSCAATKLLCELLRHLAEPCTTEVRNSIM